MITYINCNLLTMKNTITKCFFLLLFYTLHSLIIQLSYHSHISFVSIQLLALLSFVQIEHLVLELLFVVFSSYIISIINIYLTLFLLFSSFSCLFDSGFYLWICKLISYLLFVESWFSPFTISERVDSIFIRIAFDNWIDG